MIEDGFLTVDLSVDSPVATLRADLPRPRPAST